MGHLLTHGSKGHLSGSLRDTSAHPHINEKSHCVTKGNKPPPDIPCAVSLSWVLRSECHSQE